VCDASRTYSTSGDTSARLTQRSQSSMTFFRRSSRLSSHTAAYRQRRLRSAPGRQRYNIIPTARTHNNIYRQHYNIILFGPPFYVRGNVYGFFYLFFRSFKVIIMLLRRILETRVTANTIIINVYIIIY